jgi:DNA-binding MarR family transcriptional regulator
MMEWTILDAVARHGVHTVGDLARVLGISEAEAVRLVDEAESEGLLVHTNPAARPEAGELELTPEGRERWDQLDA